MSGLVGYGSSDEEEETGVAVAAEVKLSSRLHTSETPKAIASRPPKSKCVEVNRDIANGENHVRLRPSEGHFGGGENFLGPSVGPSRALQADDAVPISEPQSPFSANQALLCDLTMPPLPDFDIPPSPPGSPPPGMDQKFRHYLELKKQGTHFNEKLANSSALTNPSLLNKLMDHAGIGGCQRYANTLPREILDPDSFPDWAYKEGLAKRQEEERTRVKGGPVDFISASGSRLSSGAGTPTAGISSKGLRESVAERVMAGLNEDRINQGKIRSRSPKRRKRSRSR